MIVIAHGGIHPKDQFFHVVSDEGTLKISAKELAQSIRNVGVVILFVCSGGRQDTSPSSNTTFGLAKQILNQGCSAVISPPWPLNTHVPPNWLPAFLASLYQGDNITIANFKANRKIEEKFPHEYARCLAMTVYGNPFLNKDLLGLD